MSKKKGYIYAISNPAWKGMYKIGLSVDVVKRLSAYQTGAPMRDYYVEYSWYVDDMDRVEELLHYTFASNRLQGEWFKLTDKELDEVDNIIKEIRVSDRKLKSKLKLNSTSN